MKFQRFYENELKMRTGFENLHDNRTRPQIPTAHIARAIIYMPSLNLESLLAVDQFARVSIFRDLLGSKRSIALSDTTLQRVLPKIELEPVYAIEKDIYRQIVNRGLSKFQVSTEKQLRIAAVDGSSFGHHFASVVTLVGKGTFPLNAHAFNQYGKELPSSRATLSRLTKNLGKSWCDILVGDGLYLNKKDFQRSKEKYGCDLLVKTSEETERLIQDAKYFLFSNNPDIEFANGTDTHRNIKKYEVRAISGITWKGLLYPLKVAWIKEEKLNPKPDENPIEVFYVVTTRQDLTPDEMRNIAHARWEIENNVFKRLNSLIKSKNVHTHNFSTFIVLLLLWLIGLSLLEMFILVFKKLDWEYYYGKVRITWRFLLRNLEWSLFNLSPQELVT